MERPKVSALVKILLSVNSQKKISFVLFIYLPAKLRYYYKTGGNSQVFYPRTKHANLHSWSPHYQQI